MSSVSSLISEVDRTLYEAGCIATDNEMEFQYVYFREPNAKRENADLDNIRCHIQTSHLIRLCGEDIKLLGRNTTPYSAQRPLLNEEKQKGYVILLMSPRQITARIERLSEFISTLSLLEPSNNFAAAPFGRGVALQTSKNIRTENLIKALIAVGVDSVEHNQYGMKKPLEEAVSIYNTVMKPDTKWSAHVAVSLDIDLPTRLILEDGSLPHQYITWLPRIILCGHPKIRQQYRVDRACGSFGFQVTDEEREEQEQHNLITCFRELHHQPTPSQMASLARQSVDFDPVSTYGCFSVSIKNFYKGPDLLLNDSDPTLPDISSGLACSLTCYVPRVKGLMVDSSTLIRSNTIIPTTLQRAANLYNVLRKVHNEYVLTVKGEGKGIKTYETNRKLTVRFEFKIEGEGEMEIESIHKVISNTLHHVIGRGGIHLQGVNLAKAVDSMRLLLDAGTMSRLFHNPSIFPDKKRWKVKKGTKGIRIQRMNRYIAFLLSFFGFLPYSFDGLSWTHFQLDFNGCNQLEVNTVLRFHTKECFALEPTGQIEWNYDRYHTGVTNYSNLFHGIGNPHVPGRRRRGSGPEDNGPEGIRSEGSAYESEQEEETRHLMHSEPYLYRTGGSGTGAATGAFPFFNEIVRTTEDLSLFSPFYNETFENGKERKYGPMDFVVRENVNTFEVAIVRVIIENIRISTTVQKGLLRYRVCFSDPIQDNGKINCHTNIRTTRTEIINDIVKATVKASLLELERDLDRVPMEKRHADHYYTSIISLLGISAHSSCHPFVFSLSRQFPARSGSPLSKFIKKRYRSALQFLNNHQSRRVSRTRRHRNGRDHIEENIPGPSTLTPTFTSINWAAGINQNFSSEYHDPIHLNLVYMYCQECMKRGRTSSYTNFTYAKWFEKLRRQGIIE